MRRGVAFALAAVLGLSPCLAACSGGSGGSGGGPAAVLSGEPAEDAIKIEEIEYSVGSKLYEGKRVVTFSYTNNSDFTVVGVSLEMSFRDDVTLEQVKPVFGDSYEWVFGEEAYEPATDESLADTPVRCESGAYEIAPGGSADPMPCSLGGYIIEDEGMLDLVEPDVMAIMYLHDDKIYTEYYDFKSDSYSLSNTTSDALDWPTDERFANVPRPDGKHTINAYESDGLISVDILSMTQEEFYEYAGRFPEAGFALEPDPDETWYYGISSEDGLLELSLSYSPALGRVSISVDVVEE